MNIERIWVDMDGVVVDLIGGLCKSHGIPNPYLAPKNYGKNTVHEVLKSSHDAIWNVTESTDFWRKLEFTDDGAEFLALAEAHVGFENVGLMSSPRAHPASATGKIWWTRDNLREYETSLVIGDKKDKAAYYGSLLLDDSYYQVSNFIKAGGKALLVPRPWNRLYWIRNPIDWVTHAIEKDKIEEVMELTERFGELK